ncbi:MAG: DNA-protecting protein DprA [Firmicutes bacterium]|nr:DNA-protecting protein DprA [Bacillota bacterium]
MKYKTINIEDAEYPDSLRAIHKPPRKLYGIGDVSLLKSNCVAVVGSRHCTDYGYKTAEIFAGSLSGKGVTVVSGLAIRNRYSGTYSIYGKIGKDNCSLRKRF